MPMLRNAVIGIDIGGTKLLFALFDNSFHIQEEIKLKTPNGDAANLTRVLVETVKELIAAGNRKGLTVKAIGIGCAGSIDVRKRAVLCSPNIPALDNFSFKRAFQQFSGNVCVYNDVHAGLYGELKL